MFSIRTDFVRPCTDFTTSGPFIWSIDPVDSSVSSCDLCARNIDLWFNKSVHVTSFTFRRVRFMSRTVLSDLLGFLVLVFCPCKLQTMIPSFSRASIPSQTVMPCNLTLTILSVGPNHLGSYLISPSVNTSDLYYQRNAFGSCDTEKDLGV